MKKFIKISISSIAIFLIIGASYIYWNHEKQAPIRAGVSALKAGNYGHALKYIRPLAESGDAHAQELLGTMYAFGLGLTIDTMRARMWFREAECGYKKPVGYYEYYTALDYLDGGAISQNIDHSRGIQWLQYAAEAGNLDAQILLSNPSIQASKHLVIDQELSDKWRKFMSESGSKGGG